MPASADIGLEVGKEYLGAADARLISSKRFAGMAY
jgi:hypothetical protein